MSGELLGTAAYISPGAGARRAGHAGQRPLCVRRRGVRGAHRRPALRRRHAGRDRTPPHRAGPAARERRARPSCRRPSTTCCCGGLHASRASGGGRPTAFVDGAASALTREPAPAAGPRSGPAGCRRPRPRPRRACHLVASTAPRPGPRPSCWAWRRSRSGLIVGLTVLNGNDGARRTAPIAPRSARNPRNATRAAQPEVAAATAPAPAEPQQSDASPAQLNDQGFALMNSGDYDRAIPVLERAVAAFPEGSTDLTLAYALYNLGRSLRLAGRAGEAIPILERRLQFKNQRGVVQEGAEGRAKGRRLEDALRGVQFEPLPVDPGIGAVALHPRERRVDATTQSLRVLRERQAVLLIRSRWSARRPGPASSARRTSRQGSR